MIIQNRLLAKPSVISNLDQPCLFTPEKAVLSGGAINKPPFLKLSNQCSQIVALSEGHSAPYLKKKRVGILFSGGPAPGGHNVVAGVYDAMHETCELLGIMEGFKGLLLNSMVVLKADTIDAVRNMGGFDLLGSSRQKIETKTDADIETVRAVIQTQCLTGLIVIGGDDSNTNAVFLAEALIDLGVVVVGVPKTIDGDMRVPYYLPITFGFDTAVSVYSELVGNLLRDTASSKKYWHFVRLMGRSASHLTVSVAENTHPHLVFVSEAVFAKKSVFNDIVDDIVDVVEYRQSRGWDWGVIVFPEGIVESISDIDTEWLKQWGQPEEYDSHGNLNLSQIAFEEVAIAAVKKRLKLNAISHFYGYEGRCAMPTVFDAWYTYNLGLTAYRLLENGCSGYLACIADLDGSPRPYGVPLLSLLNEEVRHDQKEWVIQKICVDLEGDAYLSILNNQKNWREEGQFLSPGPRQYPLLS